jgi:amphiphysin
LSQVDYERYKGRTETLQKKKTRSDRENSALNKHEGDLQRAIHEYEYADEGLRTQLPRLNAATFSLLPHLLANQIILQNNLIGNLYTVLHQYSAEQGYPDPPPEPEEVIPMWEASFTSLRLELESGLDMIKSGKAIHQPMRLPDKGETVTGLGIRNKVMPGRRASDGPSQAIPVRGRPMAPRYNTSPAVVEEDDNTPPAPLSSKPSISSLNATKPRIGGTSPHSRLSPSPAAEPWGRRSSENSYLSPNGNDAPDYFGRTSRQASSTSLSTVGGASPSLIAAKKKPPPPPPPKKVGSFHGEYVTAMYDYDSQNEGDLSFREGDRIRVLKKTQSSQDWWEGELRGYKGSFPANYVK